MVNSGYLLSQPAWVRQTAGTLLIPISAGALHVGIGCAGFGLPGVVACQPGHAMVRHHNEIETSSSLSSTSTFRISALQMTINSGSLFSSTG